MGTTQVNESSASSRPPAPRGARRAVLGVLVLSGVGLAALLVARVADQVGADASPAPTPTSTYAAVDRLSWSPPALTDPTTITVTASETKLDLDPGRDYVLRLPAGPLQVDRGLRIEGGRNVVLIGGEIVVPTEAEAPDTGDRTGLLLKNQTGTIFVEGLKISGADLAEGIDLDQAKGATVVLQNIEVGLVHGSREGHHADVLQAWAGPARLRVDGLKGATQYQGLFLLPQQFIDPPPMEFDLRRVIITGDTSGPSGSASYLLWTHDDAPWLSLREVLLVDPRTELRGMVQPYDVWASGVQLSPVADAVTMPGGSPGAGYVSPGYRDGAS